MPSKEYKNSKLAFNGLLDDGVCTSSSIDDDTSICMSPHRVFGNSCPKIIKMTM